MKKLNFKKLNGLIPAIIQDVKTDKVLMLGFMNKEAFAKTLKDKYVTFFSRTKNRLWQKGETSGNKLKVVEIFKDCDNDSLLIKVEPNGPVCHTGEYSCFKESFKGCDPIFFNRLFEIIVDRKNKLPNNSYTTSLFKAGLKKIIGKIAEESSEVIYSAKKESKKRLVEESCDLIFHLFVLLAYKDISISTVEKELIKRNTAK